MERRDFVRKSAIIACGIGCGATMLEACQKTTSSTPSAPTVDFTIDISTSQYTALQTNGGYVYANEVIIARDSNGNFAALYQVCSHAGCTIQFNAKNQFPCPCHGSIFDESGNVVNGPAPTALKKYNTSLSGTKLHVYG